MDVNYLIEINGLNDWEFGNPLSATAYKVMCKLLFLANRQRFPEQIRVSNTSLCALVGCSENSLLAARQQLIQRGLIEYKGKKQHTPVYTIRYFSNNPDYNRNICGISGGISGGIDRGIPGGIDGGTGRGRSINRQGNNTDGPEEEDRDDDDAYDPAERKHWDNAPLDNPSPSLPCVDVQSGARARTYPPRRGVLTLEDAYALIAVKQALQQPDVADLYGDGLRMMQEISESDFYPLELVTYAIQKTIDRNARWPLGNAAAYTVTLLDNWKRQGFATKADVQEAKDDYWHYG